uniref:Transposase n=1 Tax=Haemonchus contortus TaxID=6289 RepID=A0A7I4YDM4_HAECO
MTDLRIEKIVSSDSIPKHHRQRDHEGYRSTTDAVKSVERQRLAAFRPQRFIRPSVRPSDACVLRRRRLNVDDNTRLRANAVNTTLATAVAARTRRTDGRRSLKAAVGDPFRNQPCNRRLTDRTTDRPIDGGAGHVLTAQDTDGPRAFTSHAALNAVCSALSARGQSAVGRPIDR